LSVLKIGEFSRLARVSTRTLRHYDELGLLEPDHTEFLTGYRYYALEQLPRLNRILALKNLGVPLGQISRLLRDELPVAELRGMLTLRRLEIEQHLREEQTRLAQVEARLKQIEQEGKPSPYEVVLKDVPPQMVAAVRTSVPTITDMPDYRCVLYDELYDLLERRRIEPGSPEYALYHDVEYLERDKNMEAAVAVNENGRSLRGVSNAPPPRGDDRLTYRELPAVPKMASVVHHGSAYDIPQAVSALFAWIGENDYSASGAYREIHLFGREIDFIREDRANLDSLVVEVQIPVEDA
jgi:DNA-binding transcriptional MerR regulator